jgi:CRP/FNR family transcriptional regulator
MKIETIMETLKQTSLFNSLNEDLIKTVAGLCRVVKKEASDLFFEIQDPAEGFYIVAGGLVKVFRTSMDGGEHILHFFRDGDMVAEAALFDLRVYPASCMALEPTTALYVRRDDFIGLVYRNPDLSIGVMNSLSKRLRKFTVMIEELSLKHVTSRLASFLYENKTEMSGRFVCRLDISKVTLASHLGTIKETLSRSFRKLKDLHVIEEKAEGFIEILELARLLNIAHGENI